MQEVSIYWRPRTGTGASGMKTNKQKSTVHLMMTFTNTPGIFSQLFLHKMSKFLLLLPVQSKLHRMNTEVGGKQCNVNDNVTDTIIGI